MKRSSVRVLIGHVLKNNQGFQTVLVGLAIDSDRAKFQAVTFGIRALVYRAREQDTLEPYERIHQILD